MSWDVKPLDEVVENFIDYRGKTPNKTNQGIPLITAKIVKDGRLLEANEYIAEADYDDWMTRGYPEIDDVVLTTEAPLGEVALIKDKNVALAQRIITLRGCRDKLNNKFLKYWFQSEYGQYELDSRASGTTVFGIKASVLKKVPVPVPPLPEQKAIASVLSSLDDKIDLLHRQNKTLEAMAETLFRQWFIEEAKEDWKKKQLGTLLTVKRGGSPRPIQDYLSDSGYRWLKISDVTSLNSPFVFKIKEHIKEEGLSKTTLLQAGKLVLSNSATPAIPKILMVDTCIHDGWLHFPVSSYSNEYLYLLFNHIRPELLQLGNGSIFTNLKTDILKEYVVKHPDEASLLKFQTVIEPIFTKLLENAKQIQTLEKLRDTLIPKLMSGEVRVQYQTEEVA
ncbi:MULTISPECIES: restriction endonuclease subunit S [unclassified Acinetobacter]|uniref:restriction endonuclease subunit S n=1 Tax=unclassified Acinetobacter TaxID=196816 RepID=UPI0015D42C9F|nr:MULTISPECIES: restriction endonuclease subunit S [unclassified Acinetobacter]